MTTAPRRTLKDVLAEYGPAALVVYLSIFAGVLVAFWFGIRLGWQPESAVGSASTLAAAYIATKVTQPLRILATLALTPIVAKLYRRVRGTQ